MIWVVPIIVVFAFAGGIVARMFRFPPMLGYISAGVIAGAIGSSVFGGTVSNLQSVSEIVLSFLLFTIGLEFSFDRIRRVRRSVIVAGILQILLVAVVVFPLLLVMNFSLPVALLFAGVFSFSSTVVVVKLLEEKGALQSYPGSHVFIFLLIQDLLVVSIIFLMPIIFAEQLGLLDLGSFIFSVATVVVVFISILIISRLFFSRALNLISRYPTYELVVLATTFVVFISIGIFLMIGIPQTIGAFLAGIIISEQGKKLFGSVRPIRDVLLVMFLVMSAMLIDIPSLLTMIPLLLFLTFVVLVIKFVSIFFVLRSASYLIFPSVFAASYLANVGEFSVVIGQFAFNENYISAEIYNLILSVFVLSLILTPFFVKYSGALLEIVASKGMFSNALRREHNARSVSKIEEELRDHVVICGYGKVGNEVKNMLDGANLQYVIVDFDRNTYESLRDMQKRIILGDPSEEEILREAHVEHARVVVVAVPDINSQKKIIKNSLKLNPKLTIICRSHEEDEKYELRNLGVNTIVVPEFEAGIRIGRAALGVYGISGADVMRIVKMIRRQHFVD